MAANIVEIRIVASGADQAARVLQGVSNAGAQVGQIVAKNSEDAKRSMGSLVTVVQNVNSVMAESAIQTGLLGTAVGALTSPFGLASAAVITLGVAIEKSLSSMAQQADTIKRLQAVTGLGVEASDN